MSKENISSAEMTAYWRSLFPQFSKDNLSIRLASPEGINKAHEFEKRFSYPLVGRKVSVRAGFMLETAINTLRSGKYDSCISIASGFSMLAYIIALETSSEFPHIKFIDLDLPYIIEERKKRIKELPGALFVSNLLDKVKLITEDLELAAKKNKKFKDLFPLCEKPVFIIEGLIYFLSNECVDWLTKEILSYKNTAVLFDYWPDDGIERSICFKKAIDALKGFIPENVKSFWSKGNVTTFSKHFLIAKNYELKIVENEASIKANEEPLFTNENEFFPVRFFVGSK